MSSPRRRKIHSIAGGLTHNFQSSAAVAPTQTTTDDNSDYEIISNHIQDQEDEIFVNGQQHVSPQPRKRHARRAGSVPDVISRGPRPPDRPVHMSQDSLFSSTSGYSNYRGFGNLAVLLLVLSNTRVALENLLKYGILANPLALITYLETDPWRYLPFAALMSTTVGFILFALWTEIQLASGRLSDKTGAIYYCINQGLILLVPSLLVFHFRIDAFASMFALGVVSCVFFKLISFGHVNYWCRKALKDATPLTRKKLSQSNKSPTAPGFSSRRQLIRYPQNLTMGNIWYFMCAPTLCYELNFPRSPKIRWWFVTKRLLEVIFLSQVMLVLSQQWIVPLLRNSLSPFIAMDLSRMMERCLKLAIPNHIIWLIFFYWIFHSILNLTAELLRFADREFYSDWWNSETITYFWRTWNIPVHRWALRHLYKPMLRAGYGKFQASIAVFIVSAFFHEFMVGVPLHLFRLYAFMGMLGQIPLNVVTTKILKGGKAGNIVVWGSLILGQPLAILMYLHDWYVMNFGVKL